MSEYSLAYLSLGSNLGDRVQNLIDARQSLGQLEATISIESSSLYWSSPVGYDQQPGFINQVLRLVSKSSVNEFFASMQKIELSLGRKRDPDNQNAPRVIDLDLLMFNSLVVNEPSLELPHPRMLNRLFVVEPLLELDEKAEMPDGRLIRHIVSENERLNVYQGQAIHRLI